MKRNLILLIFLLALFRQGLSCDPGQYDDGGTCKPCEDQYCLACSGAGIEKCTSCPLGLVLDDGGCWICGTGHGAPAGATDYDNCFECADYSCDYCSGPGDNECALCIDTSYAKDGVCVPCDDDGCYKCTPEGGTGTCTKCGWGGYYLDSETSTCPTCPVGWTSPYGSESEDACWECYDSNCDRCYEPEDAEENKKGYCYQCATGYTLVPGDDPYRGEEVGIPVMGRCIKCEDTNCLECSASGTGKCTKCKDGYFAKNGLCTVCQDKNCDACSGAGTGVCTTCATGYGLSAGKCVTCKDANCIECSGSGTAQCTTCKDGYFEKDGLCVACEDTNCLACSGAGTGACSSCKANNYLDSGSKTCKACGDGKYSAAGSTTCKTCADTNCLACSGAGSGKCSSCAANYYLDSSSKTCKACGEGKFSAAGATKCSDCADENCTSCGGIGLNQCSACAAGTYLDSKTKTCTTCATGYSLAGSTSSSDCQACADSNCATCTGFSAKSCTSCNARFYVPKGEAECSQCTASNCDVCSSDDPSACTTCSLGYKLIAGRKDCIPVNGLITISVDGETRYEMTMDKYNSFGGNNYYLKLLALTTGIPLSKFKITKVGVGSVIINYSIQSDGGTPAEQKAELEQSKALLDAAMKSGTMDAFGGVTVLNYKSGVVVTLPEDETEDTEEKKSKHLGAILGGVLGGLALIVAVGLLVTYAHKKGYFKRSSKSPQSAKYDMAKSNPTSPDSQKILKSEV